MIQDGTAGLVKAVERFDPDKVNIYLRNSWRIRAIPPSNKRFVGGAGGSSARRAAPRRSALGFKFVPSFLGIRPNFTGLADTRVLKRVYTKYYIQSLIPPTPPARPLFLLSARTKTHFSRNRASVLARTRRGGCTKGFTPASPTPGGPSASP